MSDKPEVDEVQPPRVLNSPESIWLCYGEIERDDEHRNIHASGEVLWCEDPQHLADVRYVRADLYAAALARAEAAEAELTRLRAENKVLVADNLKPKHAALIAAALDLLKALESLLEWAADVHDPRAPTRINYEGMDAARAAIDAARAALKEAKS